MGHSIWRLTVNPILFMFYFYHESFWTSPTIQIVLNIYAEDVVFVCFLVFFCSFVSGRLAASTQLVQLMLMSNCSLSGCIPVSRQQCNGELSVDVRVCSNNTALGACWGSNWKITQTLRYFCVMKKKASRGRGPLFRRGSSWFIKWRAHGST